MFVKLQVYLCENWKESWEFRTGNWDMRYENSEIKSNIIIDNLGKITDYHY